MPLMHPGRSAKKQTGRNWPSQSEVFPLRLWCEPSLPAVAAVPGVRARVAPGSDLGQAADVVNPAFRMAGALLGIRQAGVGQAQQRSVRLLDQVDLDQARP